MNMLKKFTLLDYFLLLLCLSFAGYIYLQANAFDHYTWQWYNALEFMFASHSDTTSYFMQGLIATIRLSLWCFALSLILGFLIGFARFSNSYLLKIPALLFILFMRSIPSLVFIFIFYFFIANQLIPLLALDIIFRIDHANTSKIAEFLFGQAKFWENLFVGILCISLLSSAYIAEIVRSGLENTDQGQWEAAKTLGLSKFTTYRYIILPQLLKNLSPAIAGQSITLIKDSSIVSLISIEELTFVSTEMANSSGYVFEIWLVIGLTYFIICSILSILFRYFEKNN